jgi:uridylate kinase
MTNSFHVISLGGSLVSPKSGIDTKWLSEFRSLIIKQIGLGHRFIIVVGGGQPARQYISAAKEVTEMDSSTSDWLGIAATRLNAQLLISIFEGMADEAIIISPTPKSVSKRPVLVAGGYRPGNSTDYMAVLLAKAYRVKEVINLTNVDYAYDKNPKDFPDAKKLIRTSWDKFYKIVGDVWHPGMNAPFDPIASRLAGSLKMRVLIGNGANLKNLESYLRGKSFKGTIIN